MGLNNLLREVIHEENSSTNENGDKSSDAKNDDDDSDEDYDRKSDNAVDYSDINELAEDIQTSMPVRNHSFIKPLLEHLGRYAQTSSI